MLVPAIGQRICGANRVEPGPGVQSLSTSSGRQGVTSKGTRSSTLWSRGTVGTRVIWIVELSDGQAGRQPLEQEPELYSRYKNVFYN